MDPKKSSVRRGLTKSASLCCLCSILYQVPHIGRVYKNNESTLREMNIIYQNLLAGVDIARAADLGVLIGSGTAFKITPNQV